MTTKRRLLKQSIQSILDAAGCIYADQLMPDNLTDKAIEILSPQPKKPRKQNKGTEYHHLAIAIAEVSCKDYPSNKGMLIAEAKQLSKATPTPTPDLVREHYGEGGTWYLVNYFGKQGHHPLPHQIRGTWLEIVGNVSQSRGYTI